MSYLEEAAELLRKVAADNERRNASYLSSLQSGRMEVSDAFARLAAIDRGILPADWLPELLKHFDDRRNNGSSG